MTENPAPTPADPASTAPPADSAHQAALAEPLAEPLAPRATGYPFRPEHRLHAGREYDRVYRQGARAGDGIFAVAVLANGLGHARLGMSVGNKTVGNSVRRNCVRRLIREHFRHARPELPPLDFVVTSRPGAREAPAAALLESLARSMKLAIRRAGADTSRSARAVPAPPPSDGQD